MMLEFMQEIIDDHHSYEKTGVGTMYEDKPAKQRITYEITFRDSTVIFDGYTFEATSFRKAVRKARKWAWNNGHHTWSVYKVRALDTPWPEERIGPFPYNKKYGKR